MELVSIRASSHSWEQVLKSTPPRTCKLGGGRRIQTWSRNCCNTKNTFESGHFLFHDGIVHSCLPPMGSLLHDQGHLQSVSSSGFTCLYCTYTVLAQGKQRAVAVEAAAQSWGELPSPEPQQSSGTHPSWHSRHLNRPVALCMKHCPRLWQEVVLNDRLS